MNKCLIHETFYIYDKKSVHSSYFGRNKLYYWFGGQHRGRRGYDNTKLPWGIFFVFFCFFIFFVFFYFLFFLIFCFFIFLYFFKKLINEKYLHYIQKRESAQNRPLTFFKQQSCPERRSEESI